ncbi:MAG: DUF2914 domain-containing protein [Nitrospirota bacterium]|nr:DUF2914 domain-containing protein [Nitrospirota bacterium]
MRKYLAPMIISVFMVITAASVTPPASAMQGDMEDNPGFTVSRMVIAEGIDDREPVGTAETFSSDTEKVYCFIEARDITEDTTVSFVWYFDEKEMARIDLPLKKGWRWRTYTSKKLAGLQGKWRVELEDTDGNLIDLVEFEVR